MPIKLEHPPPPPLSPPASPTKPNEATDDVDLAAAKTRLAHAMHRCNIARAKLGKAPLTVEELRESVGRKVAGVKREAPSSSGEDGRGEVKRERPVKKEPSPPPGAGDPSTPTFQLPNIPPVKRESCFFRDTLLPREPAPVPVKTEARAERRGGIGSGLFSAKREAPVPAALVKTEPDGKREGQPAAVASRSEALADREDPLGWEAMQRGLAQLQSEMRGTFEMLGARRGAGAVKRERGEAGGEDMGAATTNSARPVKREVKDAGDAEDNGAAAARGRPVKREVKRERESDEEIPRRSVKREAKGEPDSKDEEMKDDTPPTTRRPRPIKREPKLESDSDDDRDEQGAPGRPLKREVKGEPDSEDEEMEDDTPPRRPVKREPKVENPDSGERPRQQTAGNRPVKREVKGERDSEDDDMEDDIPRRPVKREVKAERRSEDEDPASEREQGPGRPVKREVKGERDSEDEDMGEDIPRVKREVKGERDSENDDMDDDTPPRRPIQRQPAVRDQHPAETPAAPTRPIKSEPNRVRSASSARGFTPPPSTTAAQRPQPALAPERICPTCSVRLQTDAELEYHRTTNHKTLVHFNENTTAGTDRITVRIYKSRKSGLYHCALFRCPFSCTSLEEYQRHYDEAKNHPKSMNTGRLSMGDVRWTKCYSEGGQQGSIVWHFDPDVYRDDDDPLPVVAGPAAANQDPTQPRTTTTPAEAAARGQKTPAPPTSTPAIPPTATVPPPAQPTATVPPAPQPLAPQPTISQPTTAQPPAPHPTPPQPLQQPPVQQPPAPPQPSNHPPNHSTPERTAARARLNAMAEQLEKKATEAIMAEYTKALETGADLTASQARISEISEFHRETLRRLEGMFRGVGGD
ncbi:hypothetical protein BJ508DRAFT_313506 [Ascobolus immersus RN42]|uniref:C2H2-type domain-containing protein n=1 Tax=Ascobolus immersus RN42 TaxID=1160509 RepID=A0A3N4HMI7_ASCIM|nr:hypothetical protein BJ508DRAFT_313506 [Ascobolus immersus RN42]